MISPEAKEQEQIAIISYSMAMSKDVRRRFADHTRALEVYNQQLEAKIIEFKRLAALWAQD